MQQSLVLSFQDGKSERFNQMFQENNSAHVIFNDLRLALAIYEEIPFEKCADDRPLVTAMVPVHVLFCLAMNDFTCIRNIPGESLIRPPVPRYPR